MSELEKEPLIRFKGFMRDWEKCRLKDISYKVNEKNKNKIYTETFTNSAEHGIISQRDFFDKDISNEKNIDNYYVVSIDDFIYNPRISNFAPVGPIKRNSLGRIGIMSPLYYIFRTHSVDKVYLEHYFETTKWHRFMRLKGNSGVRSDRLSIKDSIFIEMPLLLPSISEQIQIGAFFHTLDTLIALHQRKCDLLQQTKKTYLQKLFPRDGENVPEMRFVGFEGVWKERKLKNCFTERSERSENGELISVTINSGVVKACELDRIDSSSSDKSNYKVVKEGDIAYNSMRMWQGASGYSPYNGILSPAYTVIVPKDQVHSKFFAYNFKRYKMIWTFRINSQGLTSDTWNLKFPAFGNIKVKVPSCEEQIKISKFLHTLDTLITHHQQKLTTLETIKQTLLSQMFI